MSLFNHPKTIVVVFGLMALASVGLASRLSFRFDFEAFFPSGDPDLEFYQAFREKFEGDDNFLLVALPAPKGVFDTTYLIGLEHLSAECTSLPHVEEVLSLSTFRYAIKSPFGWLSYPAVHPKEPERWPADSLRIAGDERLYGNLISKDFQTAVIAMQTVDRIDQRQSDELMKALNALLGESGMTRWHLLGRAVFQSELVAQQKKEFVVSTAVSAVLVLLVFLLLFRKPLGVLIGLSSVLLSMLLFLGLLGLLGRPLDFMAMLYPVLMIIVGVSDVVHISTKYQLELRRGLPAREAMRHTRREIGLATFLTSATTALGFLTLVTSRVPPVRHFGYAAALGVMVAYLTVLLFTTSWLSLVAPEQVCERQSQDAGWQRGLDRLYHWGKRQQARIAPALLLFLVICGWGMTRISTDVRIYDGLPRNHRVTEDFRFFEENLYGFRPLEIAVEAGSGKRVDDPAVLREIDSLEQKMRGIPGLGTPQSLTALYKSVHRANQGDRARFYQLPADDKTLLSYREQLERLPDESGRRLISPDGQFGRISSTVPDIGTDSISNITQALSTYITENSDTSLVRFRLTGTGLLFDKNNEYLRSSLLGGLSIAFVVIGLIMAALFRELRMVLVSFVPNVVPLLSGAAALGVLNIPLDASTAIIFAIAFGIAVDDTIHFLSKYRWELARGASREAALRLAFVETGKAIVLTSVILFFGFCILLFSATPGTNFVGLLISLTLFSALFADLLLIPWLVRLLWKRERDGEPQNGAPANHSPAD